MKLTDEFDDNSQAGIPVVFMAIGVMSFILLILLVVFAVNKKPQKNSAPADNQNITAEDEVADASEEMSVADELGIGQSTLTSDQLDFWDMYKEDDEKKYEPKPTVSGSSYEEREKALLEEENGPDLSEGGIKTKVILPDGSEQWVMINSYIAKHNYDFVGLVYQEPAMKYYENGTAVSHLGIHLDKSSGDVDFAKLKKEGIEYVIIRLGARGYQNGAISIDDKYAQYIADAQAEGLEVGLSFYSQAITAAEAVEEANTVLTYIGENKITYPIVFDMEVVSNDMSRVGTQSKMTLTGVADAFCQTIKNAGFTPMIYGDKYWLLRRLDLTKLSAYDIWLSQEEETPDYPYRFAMWEYTKSGEIKGVEGEAALSISFIDYTMR